MVRVGFPTFDRAGLWRHPVVGYSDMTGRDDCKFEDMERKHDREWVLNVW